MVRVGETVKVKVLSVDLPRKRIALSIKEAAPNADAPTRPSRPAEKKPAADDRSAWEKAGFRVKKR